MMKINKKSLAGEKKFSTQGGCGCGCSKDSSESEDSSSQSSIKQK